MSGNLLVPIKYTSFFSQKEIIKFHECGNGNFIVKLLNVIMSMSLPTEKTRIRNSQKLMKFCVHNLSTLTLFNFQVESIHHCANFITQRWATIPQNLCQNKIRKLFIISGSYFEAKYVHMLQSISSIPSVKQFLLEKSKGYLQVNINHLL